MVRASITDDIEDGLGVALLIFRQRRVRPLKRYGMVVPSKVNLVMD